RLPSFPGRHEVNPRNEMALRNVAPEFHRGRQGPVDWEERDEGPDDQERVDRDASDNARRTPRRAGVVALSERRDRVDCHRELSTLIAALMSPSARSGWPRSGAA